MTDILHVPELPDDYLREIGNVAVCWSALESLLHNVLIIALIDRLPNDGRAAAVFTHMAFPQRLNALEAMLRILDEDIALSFLGKVKGVLTAAQGQRNAVLHQFWYEEEGTVKRFDVKARGELKLSYTPTSIAELQRIGSQINEASLLLEHWVFGPLVRKAEEQGQQSER